MFRENITVPVDPIPQAYADSLRRLENEPDYSLTSMGVAMLRRRVKDYKGIQGVYSTRFDKKGTCVNDFSERIKTFDDDLTLCYYTYTSTDECSDDFVAKKLPGFKEKKNIRTFVKEQANIDCQVLVHEKKNMAVVFINKREIRFYHLLLTFISLYFPILFKESPMKEDDYKLVKTLSKKEKDQFVACIQEMVLPYVAEFRRLQLGFLMQEIHNMKIRRAKNDVDNQRGTVNETAARYAREYEALKNLIVIYEGMLATEQYDNVEEEFVNYLADNKQVHNLQIVGSSLMFSVATILNNYNESAWEMFSRRGGIYDGKYKCNLPEIFNKLENRKIILDNIFSEDPKLLVKIAGNYKIDLNKCSVSADRYYDYIDHDPMYKSYLPNPHLKIFSCLGGYTDKIMHELMERNYIGAIELCVASAGSIDLDETDQTFRPFLGWLLNSKEKILRTRDGVEMTPEEALVWLIDKEKDNETDKAD